MDTSSEQLLRTAASRGTPAWVGIDGSWLSDQRLKILQASEQEIWLEVPPSPSAGGAQPVPPGTAVILSCAVGPKGLRFVSTVIRMDEFPTRRGEKIPAIVLAFPQKIEIQQRRATYRVDVRGVEELGVRMWRIGEHALLRDRGLPSAELLTEVNDLSAAGMGVTVRPRGALPLSAKDGERLRIELRYRDEELLLEGRLTRVQRISDTTEIARAGVRFSKLDTGLQGRKTLSKLNLIVGALSREELRRMHRAMAG